MARGGIDIVGDLESFKSILEMWSLEDEDMASNTSAHTMVSLSLSPGLELASLAGDSKNMAYKGYGHDCAG